MVWSWKIDFVHGIGCCAWIWVNGRGFKLLCVEFMFGVKKLIFGIGQLLVQISWDYGLCVGLWWMLCVSVRGFGLMCVDLELCA